MASQRVVISLVSFGVFLGAMYIIYSTFGTSMGSMRYAFNQSANNLTMSASWHSLISSGILYNAYPIYGWGVFWWAGIFVTIAVGVWVVKTVFIDERSDRFGGFN